MLGGRSGKFRFSSAIPDCESPRSVMGLERLVKLDDFSRFELVTWVQICVCEKVIERTHPVYKGSVREFYANFHNEIHTRV